MAASHTTHPGGPLSGAASPFAYAPHQVVDCVSLGRERADVIYLDYCLLHEPGCFHGPGLFAAMTRGSHGDGYNDDAVRSSMRSAHVATVSSTT